MVALQLYTAISITKVIAAHAVAAEATTIITSIFLMKIMPCLHAQPATLPLTKDEVVLKGLTFIHQPLSLQ